MIRFVLLLILLLGFQTGYAQKKTKKTSASDATMSESAFKCKMYSRRGDRTKAIKAKRHEYTNREYIAQLGYIDTTFTSWEHFANNALLGLVVLPEQKSCKVVSFQIGMLPKRGDVIGPFTVFGDSLYSRRNMNVEAALDRTKVGDKIYFSEIRAKCPSRDIRFSVRDVVVNIVTDSAYKKMLPRVP